MDVITEGKKIQNELVELRRYFHEHPGVTMGGVQYTEEDYGIS